MTKQEQQQQQYGWPAAEDVDQGHGGGKPVPGVRFIDGLPLIFYASHFFRTCGLGWSTCAFVSNDEEKAGSS